MATHILDDGTNHEGNFPGGHCPPLSQDGGTAGLQMALAISSPVYAGLCMKTGEINDDLGTHPNTDIDIRTDIGRAQQLQRSEHHESPF